MKKIPSLFLRDFAGNPNFVTSNTNPDAQWVIDGDGVATQKHDGTCCLVEGGVLFKRFDAKHGKTPPAGFQPAQPAADPNTGHWPGWLRVGLGPEDRWHREAFERGGLLPDGTYELCGPHIQGNPEGLDTDRLLPHGCVTLPDCPRNYDALKAYLGEREQMEGVVWHHPDGRMVKIKRSDMWPMERTKKPKPA